MKENLSRPATLLVIHTCPADLVPLLPAAWPVEFLDPTRPDPSDPTQPTFEPLTVDGPLAALALVIDGVSKRRPTLPVALAPPDDTPLGWDVVDLARCHPVPPTLDLRPIRWHSPDGLWWTTDDGPVKLPLAVDTPRGAGDTAAVLLATAGLVAESPLRRWLTAARANRTTADCEWEHALCARYLAAAVTHLLASAESRSERGAPRSSGSGAGTMRGSGGGRPRRSRRMLKSSDMGE